MNEENVVNFDLSLLNLNELIEVYNNISDFEEFLNNKIIDEEEDNDGE